MKTIALFKTQKHPLNLSAQAGSKQKSFRAFVLSCFRAFVLFVFSVIPASAQEIGSTLKTKPTLKDIFLFFANLISSAIIPLLFAAALVIFIWGVIQYMMAANDQTKREEGRKFILWGIISLFVMTAIWGILGILAGTFGGVNFAIPQLPQTM